jgi:hypothetical protein
MAQQQDLQRETGQVKIFLLNFWHALIEYIDVGHYTQIINHGTFLIGCGLTQCGTSYYAYCNHASSQSNISFPYTSGTPCSTCGAGQCSNNLCNCNEVC